MLEIRHNGIPYTLWESATFNRSLDTNCGQFSITSSNPFNQSYPLRIGDRVQIIINGISVINGFIDKITASGDMDGHRLNIAGRDKVSDLIDSSVPDSVKSMKGPVTLKAMAERIIAALGASIKVIDDSGGIEAFGADDLQAAESGQKCMDFLVSFARKRQVYLVTNGNGDLVIFKPRGQKVQTQLLHRHNSASNNVKTASLDLDISARFAKYVVRTQSNTAADPFAGYDAESVSVTGTALDPEIRSSRYLEIQGEQSMTSADGTERAKEESNLRRAKGLQYNATLQGDSQNDGSPWNIGFLADVFDDYNGVRGELLMFAISTSIDLSIGSETTVGCSPADAYRAIAKPSRKTTRKSKQDPFEGFL
jgi:prophage tail gpP-like protein